MLTFSAVIVLGGYMLPLYYGCLRADYARTRSLLSANAPRSCSRLSLLWRPNGGESQSSYMIIRVMGRCINCSRAGTIQDPSTIVLDCFVHLYFVCKITQWLSNLRRRSNTLCHTTLCVECQNVMHLVIKWCICCVILLTKSLSDG